LPFPSADKFSVPVLLSLEQEVLPHFASAANLAAQFLQPETAGKINFILTADFIWRPVQSIP